MLRMVGWTDSIVCSSSYVMVVDYYFYVRPNGKRRCYRFLNMTGLTERIVDFYG